MGDELIYREKDQHMSVCVEVGIDDTKPGGTAGYDPVLALGQDFLFQGETLCY